MSYNQADESFSDDCLPDLVPCDATEESTTAKKIKLEPDEIYDPEETLSTVTLSDIESLSWSDFHDDEGDEPPKVVPVADHSMSFVGRDCQFCQQVLAVNCAVHVPGNVPSAQAAENVELMDLSQIKQEPLDDDMVPIQPHGSDDEQVQQPDIFQPVSADDVVNVVDMDAPASPLFDDYDSDDLQLVAYLPPPQPSPNPSIIEILDSSFSDASTAEYSHDDFHQNQLDDPEVNYLYQEMLYGEFQSLP